jgi:hypothetical protein
MAQRELSTRRVYTRSEEPDRPDMPGIAGSYRLERDTQRLPGRTNQLAVTRPGTTIGRGGPCPLSEHREHVITSRLHPQKNDWLHGAKSGRNHQNASYHEDSGERSVNHWLLLNVITKRKGNIHQNLGYQETSGDFALFNQLCVCVCVCSMMPLFVLSETKNS